MCFLCLGTNKPDNAKNKAYRILQDHVWKKDEFVRLNNGPIGTHSLRKFPSTHARRNGCSRDDISSRGRWKRSKEQVDTYIDVDLPYPDAKVAAALCIGGACKYVLKENCGIADDWLLEYVVPNILSQYQRGVALTLARPLLWAAFEPSLQGYLPAAMTTSVKNAYAFVRHLEPDVNPVEKRLVVVTGHEAEVSIDEVWGSAAIEGNIVNVLGGQDGAVQGGGVLAGGQRGEHQDRLQQSSNEIIGLYSQQKETQRDVVEMKTLIAVLTSTVSKGMGRMERSINRLAKMPRQQFRSIGSHSGNDMMAAAETNNNANISYNEVAGNNDLQSNMAGDPDYNSSLSKTPKTLFVLWQEWEVGIGGRKPAKLFTRVETRGRVKFIFCWRKILWETVAMLVRASYTAHHRAIDRIYEAYGQDETVTYILMHMIRDCCTGGHSLLRV